MDISKMTGGYATREEYLAGTAATREKVAEELRGIVSAAKADFARYPDMSEADAFNLASLAMTIMDPFVVASLTAELLVRYAFPDESIPAMSDQEFQEMKDRLAARTDSQKLLDMLRASL